MLKRKILGGLSLVILLGCAALTAGAMEITPLTHNQVSEKQSTYEPPESETLETITYKLCDTSYQSITMNVTLAHEIAKQETFDSISVLTITKGVKTVHSVRDIVRKLT